MKGMDNTMTYDLENYKGQYIKMSNALIQAKEKTNLLEGKIELLAIRHMDIDLKKMTKYDADGEPYSVDYVDLKKSEIEALASREGSGSFSEALYKVARSLKEKVHIIQDPNKKDGFVMKSLYDDISYENGVMRIAFNPSTENLFIGLKDSFTKLDLPIAFSFKSNGGFQLYKILKSIAWNLEDIDLSLEQEELPELRMQYTLAELRLTLGYVNLMQDDIKFEGGKRHPNFERMNDMEKKPKYKRFCDFNRRVLEPGIEEINNMPSDIYVSRVEVDRTGSKGGKIDRINFYIQHNKKYYMSQDKTPQPEIIDVDIVDETTDNIPYEEIMEYIGSDKVGRDSVEILYKEAKGDIEKIKQAYELCCKQPHVDNFIGWMRICIREKFSDSIPVSNGDFETGERIKNEFDSYNKVKATSEFKEKVWDSCKQKEEFGEFLNYCGLSVEMLEIIDVDERVEMFFDFKRKLVQGHL